MIVIHYGASEYNPELFQPIVNSGWIKPVGGLWTSPINSKFGCRRLERDAISAAG